MLDQHRHDFQMSVLSRDQQRSPSVLIGCFDVRTTPQQQRDHRVMTMLGGNEERGPPALLCSLDLCATIQEQRRTVWFVVEGSSKKGGPAIAHGDIYRRPALKEFLCDLLVAILHRESESIPSGLICSVDVGPCLSEQFDHFESTMSRRQVQRRGIILIGSVQVGALIQKESDNACMAFLSGDVQRRPSFLRFGIDLGPFL
mmetsp:Transcript_5408/g.21396  ORF Transcript_5408/g.21396 Transcript_5408/m.21396 type:complete len:201 (+) Transcript_5408:1445-2047(+)